MDIWRANSKQNRRKNSSSYYYPVPVFLANLHISKSGVLPRYYKFTVDSDGTINFDYDAEAYNKILSPELEQEFFISPNKDEVKQFLFSDKEKVEKLCETLNEKNRNEGYYYITDGSDVRNLIESRKKGWQLGYAD